MLTKQIPACKSLVINSSELVLVASLGKAVGLHGGIRAFVVTDFPEIFSKNTRFYLSNHYITSEDSISCMLVTLTNYHAQKQLLFFQEITQREQAELFRNTAMYTTIAETRKLCSLQEHEFFYFDIIGMQIIEDEETLGEVKDIQKIANTYYFIVDNNFLIPYIDRYIIRIDKNTKQIFTRDARFLRS
ncbi:16S rRNA processing protein RimM [Helicobacter aurati]|uniref:Ribosome maturation factor RimM n=1 Tax=Helicobacter aurati TaxID=137778 RepID=A0A3D8J1D2_9HELI|nr:ribosome maturation factor RimM [Helicobacter aurati]RDU71332.1 16S rRNA processing protein RimM [Helicobacter aurati]